MLATDIPQRLPLPFAYAASGTYTRVVPTPSQISITPGAASLTDGFPPLCFTEVASGGYPQDGRDVNGILNVATAWARWRAAGAPVGFDATFSTAIGGYPIGALINKAAGVGYWYSLSDNNTTNPDTGGAGWASIAYGTTFAGNPNGNVAGVAVSASSISGSQCWDTTNNQLWICTTTGPASGAGQAIWVAVVGTVTGIGVASAHGFAGTSSGGSTPNLTLTTTVNGIAIGDGTNLSAASAGIDYVAPSQFTGANQSLANPGYQAIPGGLIFQWGLSDPIPTGAGGGTVTFPLAFPNQCHNVQLTFTNTLTPGTGKDMNPNVASALGTTGFTITQQSGTSCQYLWTAIGH